jgi:hypothetical protein
MSNHPSLAVLALFAAALTGCNSTPTPDKSTPTPTGQCNAAAVQDLIGKQANPEMLDQARRESGASIARILRPGDIVTLEYNDQRLTLSTDDALVIKRLNCG